MINKFLRTRRLWSLIIMMMCMASAAYGQNRTISGTVRDSATGEPMAGASIRVIKAKVGVRTNSYGFYSLSLPEGEHTVTYSYMGYRTVNKDISLKKNISININLATTEKQFEVEVTAKRADENIKDMSMSKVGMDIATIQKMPALMGEVDVIKSIQLLPGVQTGGEGTSGFYVRGGAVDQNLVLLDEAPVYNASHLMGFFSVFNPDAVKNVELYKGGIPAAYGGRLSSILDISLKDGNNKRFAVTGGLGSISSRLTLEGPIVKDKGSFIISGRRSYADLFLRASSDEALNKSILYFYDLNAKANYTINDKNRIYLSGYFGRDKFGLDKFFGMEWGNYTGTLRWNHVYGPKLFSNVTAIYSRYDYKLSINNDAQSLAWTSELEDYSTKADFTWYPNPNNTVRFGAAVTYHTFMPGKISPGSPNSYINEIALNKRYAMEEGVYLSNDQKISEKLSLQYGLRYSYFQNIGPGTVYSFSPTHDVLDTTEYKSGETIKTYGGFEPRLAVRQMIDSNSSIKASFNRMYQYLHLLSNTNAGASTDIWIPSSPTLAPQIADQVAVGYFRNFLDNTLEASAEVYYKWMQNQVDFRDYAQLLLNDKVENELRYGNAKAYGLELFVKKSKGAFTGWVSYTLSRTERTVPEINNGKPYFPRYDRRHNLSIIASYDINKRWNVSANWTYNTGAAVTMPVGRYTVDGISAAYVEGRNGYRLPAYHRMDLSATLYPKKKENRRFESSWNFSVYNAYGRYNTYAILFQPVDTDPSKTQAIKLSLFYIIPSVTWNFKF